VFPPPPGYGVTLRSAPRERGRFIFVPRRLATIVMVALAFGCDDAPTHPSAIQDVTWKLETIELDGASPIRVPDPERYTLRLETTERVSVRADCNSCGGTFTLSGTSLSIGSLACTRAFCGDTSLDGTFTKALGNARTLTGSPTQLVIRGDGVVLRFRS
jgi:heat shock protein HslJ